MINRREVLGWAAGISLASSDGIDSVAAATRNVEQLVSRVFATRPQREGIKLTVPDFAEKGTSIPIEITVDRQLSETDYVREILIFADDYPLDAIVKFV